MESTSSLVVVTGFGPYRNYIINSSWEAVKELSKLGLGEHVELRIMELPVKYSEVKKQVIQIWTEMKPQLSVHFGMMSSSDAIALEQCARNKGYTERDLSGTLPQGGCCLLEGPEIIQSAVNMKSVCKNISRPGVDVIHSRDAGRYNHIGFSALDESRIVMQPTAGGGGIISIFIFSKHLEAWG